MGNLKALIGVNALPLKCETAGVGSGVSNTINIEN